MSDVEDTVGSEEVLQKTRPWLPQSLDDRLQPMSGSSTEVYDPWGGRSVELESSTLSTGPTKSPGILENEQSIISNGALSEDEKAELLHKIFTTAASNNDQDKVDELMTSPYTKRYMDINKRDEDGSTALTYACCFGHTQMAAKLLDAGADPNLQDKRTAIPR